MTTNDNKSNDRPIAIDAYEALAVRYSALAETKAENGYIEHPAIRQQLGDVAKLKIVDAGCGPGILSAYLISQGAEVTAFDVSPKMVELAHLRTQGKAKLHVADMARPLEFLESGHFDLVASSLAIDYVRDWANPLREFHRALKPRGRLVFTVQHPLGAYLWYNPPTAFGVHYVEAKWSGFGGEPVVVPDYYRSFEEIVNPLLQAGFSLVRVTDTKPVGALKEVDASRFEKYSRIPTFMCIEAEKRD